MYYLLVPVFLPTTLHFLLFFNMTSIEISDEAKSQGLDKMKKGLQSQEMEKELTISINGLVGSALNVDDVFWKVESKLKYIDTNGITAGMRSEITRLLNTWVQMKNVCSFIFSILRTI